MAVIHVYKHGEVAEMVIELTEGPRQELPLFAVNLQELVDRRYVPDVRFAQHGVHFPITRIDT
jgi:hypothetical protein